MSKTCSSTTPRPPSIGQLLAAPPLGPARVQGWVRAARKQKKRTFLDVGDGSSPANLQVRHCQTLTAPASTPDTSPGPLLGHLVPHLVTWQVVADTSLLPTDLTFHSCVAITGELRPSDHPKQEVELVASQVHHPHPYHRGPRCVQSADPHLREPRV